MKVREILFWLHLAAGCTAGAIIFTMSFTGVVLTYQRQILATVERGPFRSAPPAVATQPLPLEELLQKVHAQRPLAGAATVTFRSDPVEPVEITAGRGASALYVNPYSGDVLGTAAPGPRRFFQSITAFHRWLGAEGAGRDVAKAITGACNLAFLVLIVSGAYLWLPKIWSWRHLRPIVWFRGGVSGKARDFNWHNVFGLWAAVPLFFVVLTAVPMSYAWGTRLIYQLTATQPPAPPAKTPANNGAEKARDKQAPPAAPDFAGLNTAFTRATAQVPGWTSIGLPLPQGNARTLTIAIDTGDGGQPQKRSNLVLNRATATVERWETFDQNDAGRRLRSYARFLHTGEALGIVGQTLAGIASLAGVFLVWTGISLSLRRLSAWNARRRQRQTQLTV